ncbi:Uncharacterised protein [Mycobacteroides abscessus subsp. abscessus]|nr:Uncharacterised protein [Mycobacteroides abscessus subsp. abscessus]
MTAHASLRLFGSSSASSARPTTGRACRMRGSEAATRNGTYPTSLPPTVTVTSSSVPSSASI